MFRVSKSRSIRGPAVAGAFYPETPTQLNLELDRLFGAVEKKTVKGEILGLISPHAGYLYSGGVAASAYNTLRDRKIRRVAVVSPCHVDSFQGSAVYNGDAYQTPLGSIQVDREACRALSKAAPRIELSDRGHRWTGRGEHALEVQLPFLQKVLDEFQLIPIVMGDQGWESSRALSRALAKILEPGLDCVVASSDLSHFHTYDEAVRIDSRVTLAVRRRDYFSLSHNLASRHWEACGGGPIVAALMTAEQQGANSSEILKYANSGDVSPWDRDRVVGYMGAVIFRTYPAEKTGFTEELGPEQRALLLRTARSAIETSLQDQVFDRPSLEFCDPLNEDRAVFVTLYNAGQLRGCVGSIIASEPLLDAVVTAAVNASQNDFRFPSITPREVADLSISISVLSPFHRLFDHSEIEVGRHGLMIERGLQRGLLLPQVASDKGWGAEEFLAHTCSKAGLPRDSWKHADSDVYLFTAEVFGD